MAVAIALWSLAVKPGGPIEIRTPSDIRITNVALGDSLDDETGRTSVKLVYHTPSAHDEDEDEDEDEEKKLDDVHMTVLCSLTPGKIEQATVDVVLEQDEQYVFELSGKNTVYLTGNYIDQTPDQPPYSDESEEEDYDLREVSSDVEVDVEEVEILSDNEGRFEEVIEGIEEIVTAEVGKKRPRESMEAEGELTKSQKKKQKKQKAESGKAVPADGEESTPAKVHGKEKKEGAKVNKEKKEGAKEHVEKKEGAKEDKEKKEKSTKAKASEKTLTGGVKIRDHKVGSGPAAKKGDTVHMRYIGKLENGQEFDSSKTGPPLLKCDPAQFKFRLGKGEVIKGWDVGIEGMQIGGERLLTIPSKMAYGNKKQPGIPANSTLIFEVKLLKIT
ncbi:uncharacterized protein LAESUDRAFT_712896 [Laetiporus sulphureus 93-53]|uniref:FK506-binding protein n=1 Tax=Laetiporus sulphureus 93-53 TaxID=1314785 RepID=A0A165F4J6_9APHY|nr:uncharacterized protein LAESUDRAFT_712896 [Laetiporus sulphureus 93-53]KZT08372.1 hypothetical protein LAESUDRAFT_712896 [Laetiporus sulphureus 93-53]